MNANNDPKQPQKKKKKCRGNRKLQRFRTKLRKQGFDLGATSTFINDHQNPSDVCNNEEEGMAPSTDLELLPPSLKNQV
jgi:hypothetical protein